MQIEEKKFISGFRHFHKILSTEKTSFHFVAAEEMLGLRLCMDIGVTRHPIGRK